MYPNDLEKHLGARAPLVWMGMVLLCNTNTQYEGTNLMAWTQIRYKLVQKELQPEQEVPALCFLLVALLMHHFLPYYSVVFKATKATCWDFMCERISLVWKWFSLGYFFQVWCFRAESVRRINVIAVFSYLLGGTYILLSLIRHLYTVHKHTHTNTNMI